MDRVKQQRQIVIHSTQRRLLEPLIAFEDDDEEEEEPFEEKLIFLEHTCACAKNGRENKKKQEGNKR